MNSALTKRTLLIPRMEKFPLLKKRRTRRRVEHENARRSPKILGSVRKILGEGSARAVRAAVSIFFSLYFFQRHSEPAVGSDELQFLRRRLATEHRVAMREAAEAIDDVLVAVRIVEVVG